MSQFSKAGVLSNAHVGREFEDIALDYFAKQGCNVRKNYPIKLGFGSNKKKP